MKTTYILKLNNSKYLNRLLKYQVKFKKIKYHNDICFLYVDEVDYKKLIKYKDIYNISLVKIKGLLHYKKVLLANIVFIISMIIGLIYLYILSNIIFDVKIMTNKHDLIKIIQNELNEYNIKKYSFVKSFQEKEIIRKKILNDYQDKFEWIEIERVGSKYYIRLLERIINKEKKEVSYQNVVAKKNAIILEIKASSGDIIKKINDYVNKGDVIISGKIMKKDELKKIVEAKGKIYGETWYNVKVELPRTYKEVKYTGNSYNKISFNIFDKKYFLFKKRQYQNEEYQDKSIIKSNILPFSINKTKILETKEEVYFYTYQDALDLGLSLAKEKLMETLKKDSKILYQKKLKLYEENSTINVEVFFKVYEDITDYQKIVEEGE